VKSERGFSNEEMDSSPVAFGIGHDLASRKPELSVSEKDHSGEHFPPITETVFASTIDFDTAGLDRDAVSTLGHVSKWGRNDFKKSTAGTLMRKPEAASQSRLELIEILFIELNWMVPVKPVDAWPWDENRDRFVGNLGFLGSGCG
jgi:hypothetical protein